MQDDSSKFSAAMGSMYRQFLLGSHRLLREETGAAVVVAAILFPVVIGGMGLGVETGYWYLTQRKVQHAADVSVHAAAGRKRAGDDIAAMQAAAQQVATTTGHSPAKGTLIVTTPPTSGINTGMENSVEVEITESHPRLFSSIFSSEPVKITARAVAQLEGGAKACVLALGKAQSGAVTVSGSTSVDLTNCDVASNSNASDSFLMSGGSISTDCIYTVGTAVTSGGLTLKVCPTVREFASASVDPYAGVTEPANVGTCRSKSVGSPGSSTTLTPTENHPSGVKAMRFCNGLDVKGTVTFGPGLYIIDDGNFTINGGESGSTASAAIQGSGATFYLVGSARLRLSGSVTISFSAPTSGPLSGLLFFGSRASTAGTHEISGSSGSVLQGALYTPVSHVSYRGNSSSSDGCTQIIARQITFTGSSQMASECKSVGGRDILAGQTVAIVE